jgi:hypothetical protein
MDVSDVLFFWFVTIAAVFSVGRFFAWRADARDAQRREAPTHV